MPMDWGKRLAASAMLTVSGAFAAMPVAAQPAAECQTAQTEPAAKPATPGAEAPKTASDTKCETAGGDTPATTTAPPQLHHHGEDREFDRGYRSDETPD